MGDGQGVPLKDRLIQEFGDFDEEKVPLKKQARIGQIFSGTKFITKLESSEVCIIDDIKNDKGDVFTDGSGNISKELAAKIDTEYGFSQCSAYQVRIGGLKGVLMFEPTL